MDDPLRTIADLHGVFLRGEAISLGYEDKQLRHSVRAGVLKRVRHGCYCFTDQWPSSPEERHLVLAKAVARTTPGPIAFSHTTSLILQGVDVWGADLTRVHLTRLDAGAARRQGDVVHHVGGAKESDLTQVGGLIVTNADRAVLEAGSLLDVERGLVVADSAVHKGLCSEDDIRRRFTDIGHWPGSRSLQIVVRMMNGRRESPGETRAAYLFWSYGLPAPIFQWEVYDERGVLVAIVDFCWPDHGVMGEFDGKMKYGRLLQPGQSAGDVVFDEKKREDLLRELTGFIMRRMIWDDCEYRRRHTAERFATALKVPVGRCLLGA